MTHLTPLLYKYLRVVVEYEKCHSKRIIFINSVIQIKFPNKTNKPIKFSSINQSLRPSCSIIFITVRTKKIIENIDVKYNEYNVLHFQNSNECKLYATI